MDEKIAYIYYLYDPDSFEIGYVGKTENPKKRYRAHMEIGNLSGNTPKNNWIRKLMGDRKTPQMTILETVLIEQWQDAERWWIAHLRALGYKLKNSDDGGMGGENRIISDETRRKLSEFHTGKAWNKGRNFSEEWRKNLAVAHVAFHEERRRMGIEIRFTDEQREKIARGCAILSESIVREIRDLAGNTNLKQVSIGKMFGVRQTTVSGIFLGKNYWWVKNLDGTDYIPSPKKKSALLK